MQNTGRQEAASSELVKVMVGKERKRKERGKAKLYSYINITV
jgi:hypothetical protein